MKKSLLLIGLVFIAFSCHKKMGFDALVDLGSKQFAGLDYARAIVSLSEAERLAEKGDDNVRLGQVYRMIGQSYDKSGNYPEAISYLIRAYKAYEEAGKPANARQSLFEAGLVYYNLQDYAQAEQAFRTVIHGASQAADTLMEASSLSAYSALCLEQEKQNPTMAISMLARVSNELKCPLMSEEQGLLAYSYSLLGNDKEAQRWLKLAEKSAESEEEYSKLKFREYQVASRQKDYQKALYALENVMQYSNSVRLDDLKDSVLSYQMNYFGEQRDMAQARLQATRLRTFLAIAILLAVLFSLAGYFRAQKMESEKLLAKEKEETEKYMSLAEEMKSRLKSTSRMDVLERLCENYYVYEGTDNLQSKVLNEVKAVISELRENPKTFSELEQNLNTAHGNVVAKFKEQIPRLKEEDIRLFVFTSSGLSNTAMSTLLGLEKSVVYNRIYRLKGRISKAEAPDKELFLQMLNS